MRTLWFGLTWPVWVWHPTNPAKWPRMMSVIMAFLFAISIWTVLTEDPAGKTAVQAFLDQFSFLFGTVLIYIISAMIAAAGYHTPEEPNE